MENKSIEQRIKEIIQIRSFNTLTPSNAEKDVYLAKIGFTSYWGLMAAIEDLLKISLHALYNDGSENCGLIKNPSAHIVSVLEIVIQLLPDREIEVLDELFKLSLQLSKDETSNSNVE